MTPGTSGSELFKLLVLRGPDEDVAFDPSDSDKVTPSFLEDASIDELKATGGAKIVRDATRGLRALSSSALRRSYSDWDPIVDALSSTDLSAVSTVNISLDGKSLNLAQYGVSAGFVELYQSLYNSWLLIRTKSQFAGNKTTSTFQTHESYLRAARLISVSTRAPITQARLETIASSKILLPRAWLENRAQSNSTGPRRERIETARVLLKEKKEEHKTLVSTIEDIESIELGLAIRLSEKQSTGSNISKKLNDSDINEIAGSTPGVPPTRVKGLLTKYKDLAFKDIPTGLAHDKNAATEKANRLCSSIHLFEEDVKQKLPPPGSVSSEMRPSIKAIGWGDLIVAKTKLAGYKASEIAHIENALAGEKRGREHERTNRQETVTETETEEEVTSERSLETSDRFELKMESSETIKTDFSIEAGVNTSGKYGLTKVDTSLDAKFATSNEQSYQSSVSTGQEIVSKSLEKTQSKIRELRRTTTSEEIRELSTHLIDNTIEGAGPNPVDRTGVYYWVDKVEEVQLHQYGKRLMVEFYIPEPGISLIEEAEFTVPDVRKPKPLAVGPGDITVGNYMCLTKLYGADGVQAPPSLYKQSGVSFATNPINKQDAKDAESTVEGKIRVSEGYVPLSGSLAMAGRGTTNSAKKDLFDGHVSVAGMEVLKVDPQTFEPSYQRTFEFVRKGEVDEMGIPVTGRFSGHDDATGTLNVTIWSIRNNTLMDKWRIGVYQSLKNAHRQLVEDYEEALAKARFEEDTIFEISGSPPEMNRQIERDELKKWAIKLMRVDHYEFDAIVGIGEDEDLRQEVDAAESDAIAPVVRFFETSFEWRHMSYFLYPYFWGRRDAWSRRLGITVPNDPKHEMFLKAGYARVVVPVMPGSEARVMQYLDSDASLAEEERIPLEDDSSADSPAGAESLWEELRSDRDAATARGNGLLVVSNGLPDVSIVENTWQIRTIDIGRQIFIQGVEYSIASIDTSANTFQLDRGFEGEDSEPVRFLVGSVPYGQPWTVVVPTRLVTLGSSKEKFT